MKASIEDLNYEIRWKNLMMVYTDEIFVVLNMYGQIVAFQSQFRQTGRRDRERSLSGCPAPDTGPELYTQRTTPPAISARPIQGCVLGQ
jgi:hypothetical protein